jgi:hypothetical protein
MRSAILSPGPSLPITIPKEWALYSEVVAVTDALFADAPFTAWCFQEGPGHPHQARYRRYRERLGELPVWCVKGASDRWVNHWKMPPEQVFDEFSILDLLEKLPYKSKKWWSKTRNNVRPFGGSSMFYALARLIASGSKDIHVFGSDFDGYGNIDPRTKKVEVNKRHPDWWNDRWRHERNLLADLVREAGENGVSITHYTGNGYVVDVQADKDEHWVDVDGWL